MLPCGHPAWLQSPFGPGMEAGACTVRSNCMCRGGMLCYRMVHERTLLPAKEMPFDQSKRHIDKRAKDKTQFKAQVA